MLGVPSVLVVFSFHLSVDSRDLQAARRIFLCMIDCTAQLLRITSQDEYDEGTADQPIIPATSLKSGVPHKSPQCQDELMFAESGAWWCLTAGSPRPSPNFQPTRFFLVPTQRHSTAQCTNTAATHNTVIKLADLTHSRLPSPASPSRIMHCILHLWILRCHDVSPAARILRARRPR
jgi:hypothetical protein